MEDPTYQMPPSNVMGIADITPGLLQEDVDPGIYMSKGIAQDAPLLALSAKWGLPRREVYEREFKFLSDNIVPWEDAIDLVAGYDAAVLTFKVDHAEYFCAGDIIEIVANEEVMVIASTSGSSAAGANTITVVARGAYSTTPHTIANNDQITIRERPYGDKEATAANVISQPGINANYTEDIRKYIPLTTVAAALRRHQKVPERERLQKNAMREYAIKKELAFLFGIPWLTASGGAIGNVYTQGGLRYYIPTANKKTFTAADLVDELIFNQWLGDNLLGKGNTTKFAFVGNRASDVFSHWMHEKVNYLPDSEIMNLRVSRWNSHVNLILIPHHLFSGARAGWMMIVDPKFVGEVFFTQHNEKLYPNVQNPESIQQTIDMYRGLIGLEAPSPEVHALIKGFDLNP